jgi:hypothetical protein
MTPSCVGVAGGHEYLEHPRAADAESRASGNANSDKAQAQKRASTGMRQAREHAVTTIPMSNCHNS